MLSLSRYFFLLTFFPLLGSLAWVSSQAVVPSEEIVAIDETASDTVPLETELSLIAEPVIVDRAPAGSPGQADLEIEPLSPDKTLVRAEAARFIK